MKYISLTYFISEDLFIAEALKKELPKRKMT